MPKNNSDGTTRLEYFIGKDKPVGFRTNDGTAEFQDFSGPWTPFGTGIGGGNVFGNEFTIYESLGRTSISTGNIDKIDASFVSSNPAYKYLLHWTCEIGSQQTSTSAELRVVVNGIKITGDTISEITHHHLIELVQGIDEITSTYNGFYKFDTLPNPTSIIMNLAHIQSGGGQPKIIFIRNAKIMVWRIS